MIGITGGSGSGKTTLARRLHVLLAPDAAVLACAISLVLVLAAGLIFLPSFAETADQASGGGRLVAAVTEQDDGEIVTWAQLQTALAAGGTVTLDRDYTATADDGALAVPEGVTVTLDLAGHTIDRGLGETDAQDNGYVILNEGELTIEDSSSEKTGKITGGNNTARGGGIYNSGTLNMNGGTISGNSSGTWGGGIYLPDGTDVVLNLNGGAITGNTCKNNGGGVHVSESAYMTVSGAPVVYGNKKGTDDNNVKLTGNAVIQVEGPLTEGANLHVTGAGDGGTGTVTSGYGKNNGTTSPEGFFFSDNPDYGVDLKNGEVVLTAVEGNVAYIERSWDGSAVASETLTRESVRIVPDDGNMSYPVAIVNAKPFDFRCV